MQVADDQRGPPISAALIRDHYSSLQSSGIDDLVTSPDRFVVSAQEALATTHRSGKASLWGCGGEWHHVCSHALLQRGQLRPFKTLQAALNAYIDTINKRDIRTTDILLQFSSTSPDGPPLHAWAVAKSPMYNPKVQCYVLCCPSATSEDMLEGGFAVRALPDGFPWQLRIRMGACKLASRFARKPPFVVIAIDTSDMFVERLLCRQAWNVARMEYTEDFDMHDLSYLLVTGAGDAVALEKKASQKVQAADAFMDALQLPQGSAIQRGLAAASRQHGGDPLPDGAGAGAPEVDGVAPLDELEAMFEHMLDFEDPDLVCAMEVVSDHLDGDGVCEEEAIDDAATFGMAVPEDNHDAAEPHASEPPAIPEGSGAVDPNEKCIEAVSLAGEALPGHVDDVAAGASTSSAPPPAVDFGDGLPFDIDSLGYVRGRGPPHDPLRTVGLVGFRGDGSSIFANCHLHPSCSVSCGVRVRPVTKDWMAKWLMKGEVVSRDLPRDVRVAAGKRHRAEWVRPF